MYNVLARMNNPYWQQTMPNLWAMIANFLFGVSVSCIPCSFTETYVNKVAIRQILLATLLSVKKDISRKL